MKNIGKPCAGKPHARFDEGGQAQACPLLYQLFAIDRYACDTPAALRTACIEAQQNFIVKDSGRIPIVAAFIEKQAETVNGVFRSKVV